MRTFVSAYSDKSKVGIDFSGTLDLAKQSFKEDCDINQIMRKYVRTGLVTHVAQLEPRYGDATAPEFQSAMDIVVAGRNSFEHLPANIRKRFGNDPVELLAFLDNPDNLEESYVLGFRDRPVVFNPDIPPPAGSLNPPPAPPVAEPSKPV